MYYMLHSIFRFVWSVGPLEATGPPASPGKSMSGLTCALVGLPVGSRLLQRNLKKLPQTLGNIMKNTMGTE